ncbi:SDR family oxidoreductase [Halioxenophilus aromaticivorans]|uniref:Short-chain dehydrogenase n=1 Tax=Halioxenophilus aromaticivorans TaxID=1306992 RepID=A0AAV3U4K7_9ALTE
MSSKVIVVTGAGSGLGRSLARRFASEGEAVVLVGRNISKLEKVANEIGAEALCLSCDVGNPKSVNQAFSKLMEHHSTIDVLINNAAVYEPFLTKEARPQQIVDSITINTIGPILCINAALPLMAKDGHIINVSSESVGMLFPYMVTYQAAKAGLERFTEGLKYELEADSTNNIRVTCLRAGAMYSDDISLNTEPEVAARFMAATAAVGLDLRNRGISHVDSVTTVFRSIIDLPSDVDLPVVTVQGRKP